MRSAPADALGLIADGWSDPFDFAVEYTRFLRLHRRYTNYELSQALVSWRIGYQMGARAAAVPFSDESMAALIADMCARYPAPLRLPHRGSHELA